LRKLKRNAAVDEGMEEPLEEDSVIDGHGKSKKEALVVVVPDDIFEAGIDYLITAGDRKKIKFQWEVSKLPQLSYDPSSTLFQLDPNYLAKTGLPTPMLVLSFVLVDEKVSSIHRRELVRVLSLGSITELVNDRNDKRRA
jgi:hypothetical protein